ncbi:MAG: acyltransferase, partial [Muribaculaceae bacterium]
MNIQIIKKRLLDHPKLKDWIHSLLMSEIGACPRIWIKMFVNPIYFYKWKGKGSKIRKHTIMNISPINKFRIGEKSVIEYFSLIDNGVGDVLIGSNSRIGLRNTIIGPVTIGNNTILAQNVVLSGLNHIYNNINIPIRNQGVSKSQIVIGNGTWIGANAVITSGVSIGNHCVISGGCVVTKNIPDFCVAVGNPAKIIKQYNFDQKTWI